MPTDTTYLKYLHKKSIRKALLAQGALSTKQLSAYCGLSHVTVGALLQEMMANGELRDIVMCPSEGGRPACLYEYNEDCSLGLIINAYHCGHNGSYVSATVVNLKGQSIVEHTYSSASVDMELLDTIIDSQIAEHPAIQALSFVLPCDELDGTVLLGDFENLIGVAFIEHMKERYGLPVWVDNDVNAAVRGYCNEHDLQDSQVVYLYFIEGYPPGSGIFLNGRVHTGFSHMAGEICFLPFDLNWKDLPDGSLLWYVKRLVQTYCSIINPAMIVFNGVQFDPSYISIIQEHLKGVFPVSGLPQLVLSHEFLHDMHQGAVAAVLDLLDTNEIIK